MMLNVKITNPKGGNEENMNQKLDDSYDGDSDSYSEDETLMKSEIKEIIHNKFNFKIKKIDCIYC